jgi:hypothetical protein
METNSIKSREGGGGVIISNYNLPLRSLMSHTTMSHITSTLYLSFMSLFTPMCIYFVCLCLLCFY